MKLLSVLSKMYTYFIKYCGVLPQIIFLASMCCAVTSIKLKINLRKEKFKTFKFL